MSIKLSDYCKRLNIIEESKPDVDLFDTKGKKNFISKFIADILFLSIKGDVEAASKKVWEDPELIQLIKRINQDSEELASKIQSKL